MEVSVIGSSQATICRTELVHRELSFCVPRRNYTCVSFSDSGKRWRRNSSLRFTVNAIQTEPVLSNNLSTRGRASGSKSLDGVRLYVGLPLDAVSDCNTVNHARAISVGLKALKLLGIEGVEMAVWWGIAEKEAMGKYEWEGYLALAEMVENAGLKLHVSLCFHANEQPKIPLPVWVSHIGESEPGIFFADRSGHNFRGCLSLAVDDLPVLGGKTPVQVYQEFCNSFKSSFLHLMGSTITGITMGLGPNGELRYPSYRGREGKSGKILGVGEFQCYDKNMLNLLKQHADAMGNPLWGLGGPHDAPGYDQLPNSNSFFKDQGGSWESPYGSFFLAWYSSQLLSHGNRLLSIASAEFGDSAVTTYGKVPLVHSWYKTRAHPSELTAGFYNTETRDGYRAVAGMFARNSCKMIVPGMDLSDEHQLQGSLSSPELLLAQIRKACRKYGVDVSGQNSLVSKAPHHFEQMRENLLGANEMGMFTYQRMGAEFFSPEHFPAFTKFVRSLKQQEKHADDLPEEEEEVAESLLTSSESGIQMQAA